MRALARAGACEVAAIADANAQAVEAAREVAPNASPGAGIDDLLGLGLDGLVIATPSAMHAEQAIAALEHGCAVFCQKPLARTEAEARRVVGAAREADRLLGVDLSYRYTRAFGAVLETIRSGAIGGVYAADLTFHNAYGPDKPWFRDVALAGGGCVIDLGVHLVDLALLVLGWPAIASVESHLFAGGRPLAGSPTVVEDYAVAMLSTERGQSVRLACSWNLHAGQDAVIAATFHGADGSVGFSNVGGSFYDFRATLDQGTSRRVLCEPPDDWGGRAAIAWAERLAESHDFDPDAERLADASAVIDRIYRR
jgi:predicted dehydrogenase